MQFSRGARCGIRALKQWRELTRDCTAETIAFKFAPRINAAGRLDHAMLGVRLLTTESRPRRSSWQTGWSSSIVNGRSIEADMMAEALAAVKDQELPPALVLASRQWHLGVVGIVAARLVERFHRPAIVIAIDEQGIGKGSARTIGGSISIKGWLPAGICLEAFGGHPSAAGVTIRESRLDEFRDQIFDVVARMGPAEQQRFRCCMSMLRCVWTK